MNPTLQAIHRLLLRQHGALSAALEKEKDPDRANAILTEMSEVLHRIDLVQRLLFRQSSKRLENSLPRIQAADAKLTQALRKVGDVTAFLKTASQFLKLVDSAIDIAKTLGPLAVA